MGSTGVREAVGEDRESLQFHTAVTCTGERQIAPVAVPVRTGNLCLSLRQIVAEVPQRR